MWEKLFSLLALLAAFLKGRASGRAAVHDEIERDRARAIKARDEVREGVAVMPEDKKRGELKRW